MIEIALDEIGVRYHISPKEVNTHCGFHNDDPEGKANLYINVDEKAGVFHCFAATCQARGTFADFVQRYTGWTMIKTLGFLIKIRKRTNYHSGVDAGFEMESLELPSQQNAESDEKVLARYEFRHPYLFERGLTEETLHRFRIGYDQEQRKVTFPIFDRSGKLLTIKRRSVTEKFYIYDAGVSLAHTMFGLQLVRQHGYVWIAEGEFDAMKLDQAFRIAHLDRHNAVAVGGSALLESQVAALMRRQPEAIVLMFDNDAGGEKALAQARRIVGASVRYAVAEYPEGITAKDPSDLTFSQVLDIAKAVEKSFDLRQKVENEKMPTDQVKRGVDAAKTFHDENTGLPYKPFVLKDDGDLATIRVLQPQSEWISMFMHRDWGSKISPTRCADQADEPDMEACFLCAQGIPRQLRTYIPIRKRGDTANDIVRVIDYGRDNLAEVLNQIEELPKDTDVTMLDFKVKRQGKKTDTKYRWIPAGNNRLLEEAEKSLEIPDINDLIKVPTLARMKSLATKFGAAEDTEDAEKSGGASGSGSEERTPF